MNYFELFEIPVQLVTDKETVRRQYHKLSKTHHPDYFVNTPEEEKQTSLETAALLNKAFKTLTQQDETIKYVLTLQGLLEEEEKYSLPPEFLMEMMDINEELAEADASDEETKANLVNKLKEIQNEIYSPVAQIIENYKEDFTSEEELKKVKEYYFKKKYLQRLAGQLGQKL